MSYTVSPATEDYAFAEDFLSLDHWQEYGSTTAAYRLAPEMSLGYGGTLFIPAEGLTRIVRPTLLTPGETYAFSWRAYRMSGHSEAPALQVASSGGLNFFELISPGELPAGWSQVVSRVTIPSGWNEVWLRVLRIANRGVPGYLHRIRAQHITLGGDDQ